ncbi:MAG: hypothetical protein P9X24_16825 [Candidatus Hatepunaea meridiana]|nr:hypothetical protein [Candidatus Hatepunaea meridiana]
MNSNITKAFNHWLIRLFLTVLVCIYFIGCAGTKEEMSTLPETEAEAEADTTGIDETEVRVEIGTVATPEGESIQLTTGDFHNGIGNFHPDGNHIAFQSKRDGHWQVFELNLDNNSENTLFTDQFNDENPIWTPDGLNLLFVSDRDGGGDEWERDVYSFNPATGEVKRLTDAKSDDWYPIPVDEASFLFLSERGTDEKLQVIHKQNSLYIGFLDGSKPFKIVGAEVDPSSPIPWKGNRFIIRTPKGALAVWSAEDQSTELLTPSNMKCGSATINLDKNWLVFNSREQGTTYKLYLLDLNTKTLQPLNTIGGEVRYPQFSPDGNTILYTAEIDDYYQLFKLQLAQ